MATPKVRVSQGRGVIRHLSTSALDSIHRLPQGRVHQYASAEHRFAAVSLVYTDREDSAVIVAPDAAERRELTQLVHDELRRQGGFQRKVARSRPW